MADDKADQCGETKNMGAMQAMDLRLFQAKLSEQAERYDEMAEFMKCVADLTEELTVEQRNLLSVAYKNAVGARRASWRILKTVEEKEELKSGTWRVECCANYRRKIEKELNDICSDIISILDGPLLTYAKTDESQVFYYKMKGDYYRYIAEFMAGKERADAAEASQAAYETASTLAALHLPTTNPIRLGLALNFSVFYYEIMSDSVKALEVATQAFNKAMAELDCLNEECYRDSTLIMQLLRDNIALWNSPTADEEIAAPAGPPEGSCCS